MNLKYALAAASYGANLISENHATSQIQSDTAVAGNSNFTCKLFLITCNGDLGAIYQSNQRK